MSSTHNLNPSSRNKWWIALAFLCFILGGMYLFIQNVLQWEPADLFRGRFSVYELQCRISGQRFSMTEIAGGDLGYDWVVYYQKDSKSAPRSLYALAVDNPKIYPHMVNMKYDHDSDSLIVTIDLNQNFKGVYYFAMDGTHTGKLLSQYTGENVDDFTSQIGAEKVREFPLRGP